MSTNYKQAEDRLDRVNLFTDWIIQNVPEECYGLCKEYSKMMSEYFPRLTQVKGLVTIIGPFGTQHEAQHWWCVTPNGVIVDPTAKQFCKVLSYDQVDGNPTGKCPNCGSFCFQGAQVCSDKCGQEYVRYLNGI